MLSFFNVDSLLLKQHGSYTATYATSITLAQTTEISKTVFCPLYQCTIS